MLTQPEDYLDTETFARIKAAADQQETPVLIIDTMTFSRQLDHLIECFPFAKTYYAVKANPEPEVLSILCDRGCNFDVASRYELDKVMSLGIFPVTGGFVMSTGAKDRSMADTDGEIRLRFRS